MILSLFNRSLTPQSDEQLMERVALKDDGRAFDELYHRHSRRLMGWLTRQVGSQMVAADLMQDTFLRVWKSRGSFRSERSFKTWLFAIGYNLLVSEYRKKEQVEEYTEHVKSSSSGIQDDDSEIRMDNETFDAALKAVLVSLDTSSRMLFSLRFEEEMTVSQIAEIMSVPEGTVKSRLFTLTRLLKEKLKVYEVRR